VALDSSKAWLVDPRTNRRNGNLRRSPKFAASPFPNGGARLSDHGVSLTYEGADFINRDQASRGALRHYLQTWRYFPHVMKCLPVIGVGRIVALLKGETICDSSSRSRTALGSISYIDEGSFSRNNARVTTIWQSVHASGRNSP